MRPERKTFCSKSSQIDKIITFALVALLGSQFAAFVAANDVRSAHGLNFEANFGNKPQPFTIHVDQSFIDETKAKAGKTRLVIDMDQPDFIDGVPSRVVGNWSQYWAKEYDWRKVEKSLNQDFQHFTTTVKAGTFHEVAGIIDLLTNPPNDTLPAFHVVAPDLPGFGFSPAPSHAGLGSREMGQGFNDLMAQLGYNKYVGQGGDFGSHILRTMSADFPTSLVSILSNLFNVSPNSTDLERFANNQTTPEETSLISMLTDPAFYWTAAYWDIEKSVPLQVAISLTDSPVAWLAWQYMGMRMMTPGYEWKTEELITWSMLNYIQGPYGGFRLYKEADREGILEGVFPYVKQPVGVVKYYGDAGYDVPLKWAQRQGNIVFFRKKSADILGGHFPAFINPQALVEDCWAFWGDKDASGTSIFF
ncbi:alpha beta-hydrolase [Fusarium albosuccineum]|uniref:Alpha beta-hydrolase n=1 Tax=Fusarium albosuccineum TaxID=1237068 RepID=A0A8H4KX26_9HYPO|nr:alpha beta-hydrolase [Fusarium albosuccineum]